MSQRDEHDISVEDHDLGPRWHLRTLAVLAVVLLVVYLTAVHLVLK